MSAAVLALVLSGCSSSSSSSSGSSGGSITLYNGQHPQLTTALVAAFEKQSGIHVDVRTSDSITLADQLLQEGSNSPADVFLCENSPELTLLSEHHLLAKLPTSLTSAVPAGESSSDWVGVALRVLMLAYNPSKISASQLPTSVMDLSQPQWKGRVAIPPTDSDFVPQVGAVLARNGQMITLSWLKALKTNSVTYQDEESTISAVNQGLQSVGLVNQYYWYRLRLELGEANTDSKLASFAAGDVGNAVNIGGTAVLSSSKHSVAAQKFVAFLVSEQGQKIIAAGDDFEYPAVSSVAPNPALPVLSSIPTTSFSQSQLGDDLAAAKLLQQVGLT